MKVAPEIVQTMRIWSDESKWTSKSIWTLENYIKWAFFMQLKGILSSCLHFKRKRRLQQTAGLLLSESQTAESKTCCTTDDFKANSYLILSAVGSVSPRGNNVKNVQMNNNHMDFWVAIKTCRGRIFVTRCKFISFKHAASSSQNTSDLLFFYRSSIFVQFMFGWRSRQIQEAVSLNQRVFFCVCVCCILADEEQRSGFVDIPLCSLFVRSELFSYGFLLLKWDCFIVPPCF